MAPGVASDRFGESRKSWISSCATSLRNATELMARMRGQWDLAVGCGVMGGPMERLVAGLMYPGFPGIIDRGKAGVCGCGQAWR